MSNLPASANKNPAFLAWGTSSVYHQNKKAADGLTEMIKESADQEGIAPLKSKKWSDTVGEDEPAE